MSFNYNESLEDTGTTIIPSNEEILSAAKTYIDGQAEIEEKEFQEKINVLIDNTLDFFYYLFEGETVNCKPIYAALDDGSGIKYTVKREILSPEQIDLELSKLAEEVNNK